MLNRPFHELSQQDAPSPTTLDRTPALRLALLFGAIVLLTGVVVGRVGYLQCVIPERFEDQWNQTTTSLERIPAQDGRILTADGSVVAADQPRYDLLIHYRWLEDPPDPSWLAKQARSRLSQRQRRDRAAVEQQQQAVLAERQAMREALSAVTGLTVNELNQRAAGIQARIERMHRHVEEIRESKTLAEATPGPHPDGPWWESGWNAFVSELTTPPSRETQPPLVLKEQEDYHPFVQDVTLGAVTAVEQWPSRFPGVRVQMATRRTYPRGPFAAHVIGGRTPLTGDEFRERQDRFHGEDPLDYQVGESIGRNGIERAYDRQLRGQPGLRRVVRDRDGLIVHTEIVREPRHGRDVVLTLDSRLQQHCETLLDETIVSEEAALRSIDADLSETGPPGACLVAVDVRTGRVIAAAAAPRYDLRLLVDHDAAAWQRLLDDPRRPFFPRVTQMTIPPGSVFKTLSAVALLESGLIDPDAPTHCRGYLDQPDRDRCLIYRRYGVGHGDMNLDSALCQSCNVYFYDAARRMGPDVIYAWADRFGLGRPSGADLPGEQAGELPSPHPGPGEPDWYPGTTLQLAIGQASLTVTPLQVARMMAAVANDGYLVTPHFAEVDLGDPSLTGNGIAQVGYESIEPATVRRVPGLSPDTLARVRVGLRQVVEHPQGTGRKARIDAVSMAGKTGTAEVGGGKPDHAWFAGYVPADRPRIAFVAVVEHGGGGGSVAGPVVQQFVEKLLELGLVTPDRATAD